MIIYIYIHIYIFEASVKKAKYLLNKCVFKTIVFVYPTHFLLSCK